MFNKQKLNFFLYILLIIILLLSIISGFAMNKTGPEICKKIKRQISMCDFFVYSSLQKKICINNVKRKFGMKIFKRCCNRKSF